VGDDDAGELGHFIADEGPAPADEVHEAIAAVEVQRALEDLPETERKVISLRFGTSGEAPQTSAQTARKLGIAPREAASAEERALRKLAGNPALEALREAA
jgi:DNA-directed RNA polymerase sigma subunit (sigma70/sigma32)